MATNCDLKKTPKFKCKYCDFSSEKKSEWNRHCETKKHKSRILATNSNKKTPKKKFILLATYVIKYIKTDQGYGGIKKGVFSKMTKKMRNMRKPRKMKKKKKILK